MYLVVLVTQGAVVGVSVVQAVNLLAAVSALLLLVLNKGFMDSRHFVTDNHNLHCNPSHRRSYP